MKKLGKGLEEISYLFLSSEEENAESKDQAANLTAKQPPKDMATKSICLIGDNRDVRDAFLVVNLSLALARLGMRIAVVDMDEQLSCLKFFLGRDLEDWERSTPEALIKKGPLGVHLIGLNRTGLEHLADSEKKQQVAMQLEKIEQNVDLILINVMQNDLLQLNSFLQDSIREFVVMVPPDKNKMLDAYRIIKTIFSYNPLAKIGAIITGIDHMYEIEAVYNKMSDSVRKFLDKELHKYGFLFKVKERVDSQSNISSFYDADLTACISNIAQIIVLRLNLGEQNSGTGSFFKKILNTLKL